MKKLLIGLVSFIACITLYAQDEFEKIIDEGIALHDKGDYAAAIKKYDEVLAKNAEHFSANYEKSYTLLAMKKYDECIAISKMLNEKFPDHKQAKNVYVNWGSALDDKGDPSEALKVYNKGISAFPDFYLLYYNKAVTYAKQDDRINSLKSVQDALSKRPLHASSHNLIGLLIKGENNIPSLLATLTFLVIEPEGKRAEANVKQMESILGANVTKTGEKNVTINMSADLVDDKKKKEENNFRTVEMMLSLSSALDYDDKYKNETKPETLERKLGGLISMMSESKKDNKGFFWDFYAPFFREMKSNKHLTAFCHIVYSSANDEANDKWITANEDKIKAFYEWVEGYKWSK